MSYALRIGLRYLRSKKRRTISVITIVAVIGVALGVGALLSVLAITSGFQNEFRDKVLGVNAHVLVLKYGIDFREYGDVMAESRSLSGVEGAAPFLIHEMMLAKGNKVRGVLVKGVDPALLPTVLDLPRHLVDGSLDRLRAPGAAPPLDPDDLNDPEDADGDLDAFLRDLAREERAAVGEPGVELEDQRVLERIEKNEPVVSADDLATARRRTPAPEIDVDDVPDPADVEASLAELPEIDLPDDELEAQILAEEEARRESPEPARLPGIVLGATLAKSLEVGVGDVVRLISPLEGIDVSAFADVPRTPPSRELKVIAIFEAGFQEYDTRLVYVDLFEAQRFFDRGDTVTGVEIRLRDIQKADATARSLERVLERSFDDGAYHVMSWSELNHNLFQALAVQKVVLSVVIGTIIFVAAFNVIATLIMIVLEKKREVAILKAVGAHDGGILVIFLVQGLVIGILGTAIGLALGGGVVTYLRAVEFPLDPKVYLVDHLPVSVRPLDFVVTTGVALAITALATLVPSLWAARLMPADGVRYE